MKISKLIVMVVAVVLMTALGYGLASWFIGKPSKPPQEGTALEQTLAQLSSASDANQGDYAVGDRLVVRLPADGLLRDAGGKRELLLPVRGPVTLEYRLTGTP